MHLFNWSKLTPVGGIPHIHERVTAGRLSPPLKKNMHVRLSNNIVTRETLNGIEGIVSIKKMEHQPTSGGFGWSLAEEEPYSFRGASALQVQYFIYMVLDRAI